ncbi:arrestin C-terminal domain-containing protein [Aspergillus aculeatinus CBS 121060]|uniref:Arrestin domain protein n=2 Tax=Aspergillus subgen. Circumdati TaxID=2720871 RepID=A0ACD1GWW8_9EURO|nr:arrestin domain protein [Aspergillus brunneoviolaceus CBS 621.78]XP_025499513.1 arrestin domain protein [Aspergillus aculeatinus CBS 121060]RAH48325.1 arrestin domain protein [Aspergillus brunneoviolaceus CBS 621.78]RAH65690.1 arrestin domain protein [Aspergillus aculeatinus CBS 121060]
MTAHVSPLPQVLLGSVTSPGGTNTQFPDGVSESTPFHVRSDRRPSLETSTLASDTSSTVGQPPARRGFRRRASILKKLAGPRENAKRLFRLGSLIHSAPSITPPSASSPPLPSPPSPPSPPPPMTQTHSHRPVSELVLNPNDATMLTTSGLRVGRLRSHSSSTVSSSQPYPASAHSIPSSDPAVPFPPLRNEKIVATGSGISVGIALTEPVLYLQGYDQNDPSTKKSAILRGQLHLKITKSVKVKKISICFRGHAQTDWPDGIPPKKVHFHDKKDLVTHGVMYFNHGDTALMQNDYGAHFYQHAKPVTSVTGKEGPTLITRELLSKTGSSTSLSHTGQFSAKDLKRLSLNSNHSRSFGKNDPPPPPVHPPRNYRLFPVGDYLYSFEFPIDGSLPETIKTDLGFVQYDLEAIVERAGAFRPNLLGSLEVPVIRTPAEGSLEQVEPIAISRNWEDQLHYDIVISGKSFPLGSQVPIAFKLTPLAKVECHRIKVYVTENIQHWTADKSVHRFQPAKKVLLFEKRADSASTSTYPGSSMRVTAGGGIDWDQRAAAARGQEVVDRNRTNLLGNLSSDSGVGPTEMEFNVQLPSCQEMRNRDESQRLHFDTTYENIQINHWIKIVLRLSKVDERDPGKRRHFEISIDSPFHLLSCKATQANIYLPAYTSPESEPTPQAQEYECGCPGAPLINRAGSSRQSLSSSDRDERPNGGAVTRSFTNSSGGLTRPPQAHLADEPVDRPPRPMHLLRAPSFAPPAFEELEPPPPLVTPPPEYNTIVGDNDREAVLQDYFSRLSFYEEHADDDRGLGRVDVPLTPGGRVNRSMDVPREWVRLE